MIFDTNETRLVHFQTQHKNNRKEWDEVTVRSCNTSWEWAVLSARAISKCCGVEIRLTHGPNPLLASGCYIFVN